VEGIIGAVDADAIARRRFRVVLDCGNGASVPTSPWLLRRLGCQVITLNGHLDGTFPGHLSEPTPENLADLVHTVPAIGADLGIAHDGDADRAVFVDAQGTYLPGEKILTLMAQEFVRRNPGGVVVTPVSASQSVEDVVRPLGGEVVYTRVGSPVVTHEMQFARDMADRILFFEGGRIAESGTPEQIFTCPQNERTRDFVSRAALR
jgi:phosphomannomutase/phosphoglucomutase